MDRRRDRQAPARGGTFSKCTESRSLRYVPIGGDHANGSLGKFNARFRTRKAKKQIPGDALTGMQTAAGQLRHDLVMLRNSR